MLDFTSSLYLGLAHPSAALRPWSSLTTGRPAALLEPPGAATVAARLAAIQGREAAGLATSTLHLGWDLFGMLDGRTTAIFLDEGAYPVVRWGV
ncbi:MAG: pyridoxal phosphate-dependent aminotransferase family protein, partial [Chloroflexales bacterium]|nr:pyridoxal phosphate-dependent aminotransferase family protein [Chloroflexales bacterium]